MKYFRVSLVTVKILGFFSEINTKINTNSVKVSGEEKIGTTFYKTDIYDPFSPVLVCDHSQIIILHTSYIAQVYLTLIFLQNTL